MADFGTGDFVAMFVAMDDSMQANRDRLCELDGHIGDADHGVAMATGFAAVRKAVEGLDAGAAPADAFNAAAKAFLNAVGASSGPLYATAFMRAGAALKGKGAVGDDDVAGLIPAMAKGVADRGKAEVGDKTMRDAWQPAADAVTAATASRAPLSETMAAAAAAAETGAEATEEMIAKMGRAARLGERSRGHVDPGAASAALLIRVMAETLGGPSRSVAAAPN